jgi:hypothetical protein
MRLADRDGMILGVSVVTNVRSTASIHWNLPLQRVALHRVKSGKVILPEKRVPMRNGVIQPDVNCVPIEALRIVVDSVVTSTPLP